MRKAPVANAIDDVANDLTNTENADDDDTSNAPATSSGSSYRYRDAGKRRAYMRDLMRKRRAAATSVTPPC
jgi:hypothetical protein